MGAYLRRNKKTGKLESRFWWISYADVKGETVRESSMSTRKTDAEMLLRQRQMAVDDGKNPNRRPVPRLTLAEFSETYLKGAVTQKSYKRAASAVRQINSVFGNVLMNQFTFKLVDKWKKDMVNVQGYSERTADRYLATLKCMFSYARRGGDVSEEANNIVRSVKKYNPDDEDVKYLSQVECQRLIDSSDPHLRPLVITGLHTGMRPSEIFTLTWRKVDFDNGIIRLSKTKTGILRNISISPTLEATLTGLTVIGSEYVFINPKTRKPYTHVKRSFKSARERAGIPADFHFRNLRDTWASQLALGGAHPKMIQRVGGWKTIKQVMKYINLADDEMLRAGSIIERRLVTSQSTTQREYSDNV